MCDPGTLTGIRPRTNILAIRPPFAHRTIPNLDSCLSRAGTRRGSQRSVFEIVVVIEGRARARRLRRQRTLQELWHVAVARLARFARPAPGPVPGGLWLPARQVQGQGGLAGPTRRKPPAARRGGG